MNITGVKRVHRSQAVKNPLDTQIEMLRKQRTSMIEKMNKIYDNDEMAAETKSSSIYTIKKSIEEVNIQIEQLQLQKIQQQAMSPLQMEMDEQRDELLRKQAEEVGVLYDPSITGILKAENAMRITEGMSSTKSKLEGEIKTAEKEANSSLSPSKYQAKRLAKLRSNLSTTDNKMEEILVEINEETKKEVKKDTPFRDAHRRQLEVIEEELEEKRKNDAAED